MIEFEVACLLKQSKGEIKHQRYAKHHRKAHASSVTLSIKAVLSSDRIKCMLETREHCKTLLYFIDVFMLIKVSLWGLKCILLKDVFSIFC